MHTLINLSFFCLYGGMVQKRCNGSSFSKNCSIHAADLNTCMKGKGGDWKFLGRSLPCIFIRGCWFHNWVTGLVEGGGLTGSGGIDRKGGKGVSGYGGTDKFTRGRLTSSGGDWHVGGADKFWHFQTSDSRSWLLPYFAIYRLKSQESDYKGGEAVSKFKLGHIAGHVKLASRKMENLEIGALQ